MWKTISNTQKDILNFYKDFLQKNWRSPTYLEASDLLQQQGIKMSWPAIYRHIKKLESLWYVSRNSDGSVSTLEDTKKVLILGNISCWFGIDVIEEPEDSIEIPISMTKGSHQFYALKAKGDSMKNANIWDWDLLIIKQQNDIDNDGDVAVIIKEDNTATLKRVFKKDNFISLKPENEDFPIMFCKNCEIRGKLVGVIRNFK